VKVASVYAEIVLVEHEVLRQVGALAEHQPADARVHQPVLVARDVDRADLLEPEIPLRVRVQERPDEPSARAVDVERHVEAAGGLQLDQEVVDPDNVVGMAGERGSQDRSHADRVLVHVRLDVFRPDRVLVGLQRHDPRLHVEVAAELLSHHVDVAAEHQVRPVDGLAGGLPALTPVPLQRQGAQHDGLG
jgi:hypothetical protein